jgi:hypothetical protein
LAKAAPPPLDKPLNGTSNSDDMTEDEPSLLEKPDNGTRATTYDPTNVRKNDNDCTSAANLSSEVSRGAEHSENARKDDHPNTDRYPEESVHYDAVKAHPSEQ